MVILPLSIQLIHMSLDLLSVVAKIVLQRYGKVVISGFHPLFGEVICAWILTFDSCSSWISNWSVLLPGSDLFCAFVNHILIIGGPMLNKVYRVLGEPFQIGCFDPYYFLHFKCNLPHPLKKKKKKKKK